jgi:SAM-dependent methyltransferase
MFSPSTLATGGRLCKGVLQFVHNMHIFVVAVHRNDVPDAPDPTSACTRAGLRLPAPDDRCCFFIYACRFRDVNALPSVLALLADPTRLRLLRALAQDRFNVTELTRIVAVSQSGVSRHLRLMSEAGLVDEVRQSTFVYYRLRRDEGTSGPSPLWALLDSYFRESAPDRDTRDDEARMAEVLRLRREQFGAQGDARPLAPGRSWAAWARALGHLLPPIDVADIGCGEGYLTIEMATWARRVTGIDRSDDVLEQARGLAARRHVENIEWKKGDLARLPLREASVDLAVLSQSLHHASEPERALADAARIVRGGGRVLVLELRKHDQVWVRSRFGDRRLGFSADELQSLLEGAGLASVRVSTGAGRRGDPFGVVVASGQKPADKPPGAARTAARAERLR